MPGNISPVLCTPKAAVFALLLLLVSVGRACKTTGLQAGSCVQNGQNGLGCVTAS